MAYCQELTLGGYPCCNKATSALVRENGTRELLCTLHANRIDPTRTHRKWESVPSAKSGSPRETT